MVENNQDIIENIEEQQQETPREIKDYETIGDRLKEIEEKISSSDIDMDESLKLYEEAVNLGMKASQTIENNVLVNLNDASTNKNMSQA